MLTFFFCFSAMPPFPASSTMKNISLIPYENHEGLAGYVNADTFEIIIPAQYYQAYPFVGDFAFVRDLEGNTQIINKDNNKMEGFPGKYDDAYLLKMDEGEHVFLLTKKRSWLKTLRKSYSWLGFYDLESVSTNYRMYNVSTGRAVTKKDVRYYKPFNNPSPIVAFIDNYLIYDETVYQIEENGNLKKLQLLPENILTNTIAARNLQHKEQVFQYNSITTGPFNVSSFDLPSGYFDFYFPYIDTLDVNILLQIVPQNMEIEGHQSTTANRVVNYLSITPINWDPLYPLPKNDIFYEIRMISKENRAIIYTGLYNASENRWIIDPFESFAHLYSTHYENFIKYNYTPEDRNLTVIYDLNTRKKYTNVFDMRDSALKSCHIVYLGYRHEYSKQHEEPNKNWYFKIEDF